MGKNNRGSHQLYGCHPELARDLSAPTDSAYARRKSEGSNIGVVRRIGDFVRARRALTELRQKIAGSRGPWFVVDLDNTLIETGSLVAKGMSLQDAAEVALPMPGMMLFLHNLRAARQGGRIVFLSARPHTMLAATRSWLEKHGAITDDDLLVLTPRVTDKPAFWRLLRHHGPLAIIDDLAYGKYTDRHGLYSSLIALARSVADVYIGNDQIEAMEQNPEERGLVLQQLARGIGCHPEPARDLAS